MITNYSLKTSLNATSTVDCIALLQVYLPTANLLRSEGVSAFPPLLHLARSYQLHPILMTFNCFNTEEAGHACPLTFAVQFVPLL